MIADGKDGCGLCNGGEAPVAGHALTAVPDPLSRQGFRLVRTPACAAHLAEARRARRRRSANDLVALAASALILAGIVWAWPVITGAARVLIAGVLVVGDWSFALVNWMADLPPRLNWVAVLAAVGTVSLAAAICIKESDR